MVSASAEPPAERVGEPQANPSVSAIAMSASGIRRHACETSESDRTTGGNENVRALFTVTPPWSRPAHRPPAARWWQ
jgi:hypothetical protein